jgi:hypothetical protein
MGVSNIEIVCTACGAEALLRREPVYDGFRKTGETLACSACGHVYPDASAVTFKVAGGPAVFADTDRPAEVRIFSGDEAGRNCRHCVHYTVNPFTQRCSLQRREVQATDCCARFEAADTGDNAGTLKTLLGKTGQTAPPHKLATARETDYLTSV